MPWKRRHGPARLLASLTLLLLVGAREPVRSVPTFSGRIGSDAVSLSFEPWFAGAVSRLTFRGKSYVNAADHGRLIQSALSLDGWGECLNPTEAGSVADGRLRRTTSILLDQRQDGGRWRSRTRMAYWLPPAAKHQVNPADLQVHQAPQPCSTDPARRHVTTARNSSAISSVILDKRITLNHRLPNVLRFETAYTLPERHQQAMFEPLTAYLEPEFRRFYEVGKDGALKPVTPQHSTRSPLIAATSDGKHAMGIVAQGSGMYLGAFRWPDTSKLNCFEPRSKVAKGRHAFECWLIIGTLEETRRSIAILQAPASRRNTG